MAKGKPGPQQNAASDRDAPIARILNIEPTGAPGVSMVEVECPFHCNRGHHFRPWWLQRPNRSWACTGNRGTIGPRFRIAAA